MSSIPKIIHQIWLGRSNRIKNLFMRTVKDHNQNYEYFLWRKKDITKKNFPLTFPYIQICLKLHKKHNINKYAQISDLMRLEIIYKYGGWYLDSNFEMLTSLDDIKVKRNKKIIVCNEQKCAWNCVGERITRKYLSNGAFASFPHNPHILLLIKRLYKVNWNSKDIHVETGPYFFRSMFVPQVKRITAMLPFYTFYPFITYDSEYRKAESPKYLSKSKSKKHNIKIGSNKYIEFPCQPSYYPKSIAVNHLELGASWVQKE